MGRQSLGLLGALVIITIAVYFLITIYEDDETLQNTVEYGVESPKKIQELNEQLKEYR